jgi:hypothetical protein
MADIIETMKTIPDYIGSNGRTDTEIADAENALGTVFAPDYKRYLKEVGLACFGGHEFTGLTTTERLSVLSVTKQERTANKQIPESWYVVEQTNYDGIVVWQAPTGEIYQSVPGLPGQKIYDSLAEFISSTH